jgi:hypothetical protein
MAPKKKHPKRVRILDPEDFTPIDWAKIDPGIVDVVRFLRERGFDTFNSCQGGPGHTYERPSVSFLNNTGESFEEARERGVCSLLAGGYRDFSTNIHVYHGFTRRPEAGGWPTQVDVEFWVDEIPILPYARAARTGGRKRKT